MRKFKTESKKLLDLMINSIYTNKEIFLRELISNASDAVDKLYFKSLTDQTIGISKNDLEIDVDFDKESRTITISDTGIGVTKEELETNWAPLLIPVVSSSRPTTQKHREKTLILLANLVLASILLLWLPSALWSSLVPTTAMKPGSGKATALKVTRSKLQLTEQAAGLHDTHGTTIVLFLKDNTEEEDFDTFLDQYELQALIKQYSNYVRYPIRIGGRNPQAPT